MESLELLPILEALLFVSDQPLTVNTLVRTLDDGDVTAAEVRDTLDRLVAEYDAQNRGWKLLKLGGGYQIVTREAYAPWVKELLAGRQKSRLSRAALETIAVIAYKQPIGRLEIERIRGVDAGGVLNTLLERGVIMIKGRDPGPGRPLLYGTTQTFLDYFNLAKLSDLPNMGEIAALARAEGPEWSEAERDRLERHGIEPDSLVPPPEEADVEGDRAAFQDVVADVGSEIVDGVEAQAGAQTTAGEGFEVDGSEGEPARS